MKTYVIHADKAIERRALVDRLVKLTKADIFPAIILPNGGEGCTTSHFTLYSMINPEEDLLVFEDDCEILNDAFLTPLEMREKYDIIYIGVTAILPNKKGSYGTHAMWISSYAKKCFLEYNGDKKRPIDHLWNDVEEKYNLKVWRPSPVDKYVRQKLGLKSMITGKIREIPIKKRNILYSILNKCGNL